MLADQYKTENNQFERLGHPGRIFEVYKYTSGQVDFTGSMYGYGAVHVKTHGNASIELSGGGNASILAADINTLGVVPLSVKKISGGSASVIYVFKVRGSV